jgi:hypothetical protein
MAYGARVLWSRSANSSRRSHDRPGSPGEPDTGRSRAAAWTGRVNTVTARTDRVDVDALLIRSDGCVAWALPTGQDLDATTLVRALGTWFGQPA